MKRLRLRSYGIGILLKRTICTHVEVGYGGGGGHREKVEVGSVSLSARNTGGCRSRESDLD